MKRKERGDLEIPDEEIFIGPNDIDMANIENEILEILPYYTAIMEPEELRGIIDISQNLKIDRLRIHIYEEQKDYEE